ncbi:hypothetical protein L596_026248 [Steinernema carpocapsae]|nr:hypothetical protein L596_026248 [Steinernema carpocapsae]
MSNPYAEFRPRKAASSCSQSEDIAEAEDNNNDFFWCNDESIQGTANEAAFCEPEPVCLQSEPPGQQPEPSEKYEVKIVRGGIGMTMFQTAKELNTLCCKSDVTIPFEVRLKKRATMINVSAEFATLNYQGVPLLRCAKHMEEHRQQMAKSGSFLTPEQLPFNFLLYPERENVQGVVWKDQFTGAVTKHNLRYHIADGLDLTKRVDIGFSCLNSCFKKAGSHAPQISLVFSVYEDINQQAVFTETFNVIVSTNVSRSLQGFLADHTGTRRKRSTVLRERVPGTGENKMPLARRTTMKRQREDLALPPSPREAPTSPSGSAAGYEAIYVPRSDALEIKKFAAERARLKRYEARHDSNNPLRFASQFEQATSISSWLATMNMGHHEYLFRQKQLNTLGDIMTAFRRNPDIFNNLGLPEEHVNELYESFLNFHNVVICSSAAGVRA